MLGTFYNFMTEARVQHRDFEIHKYGVILRKSEICQRYFFLISNVEYIASWLGALYRN